jgi:serine/threonine protein kinase
MLYWPSRIDRYDIKNLIGGGGMGTLLLARDTNPNTNRLVALKLLNANLDSGDLRERFARESRALAALNHPNIVNIYDSGEYQGSPYIVMEYVRGESIAEQIKRKAPLSLGQKLKLMAELCAGLGHAHEAGMIHRDIKPANLMVDQHGRLKILDFGIARVSEGSFTRAGLQVTQFNVRIGTPGYMSPEQIETGEVDRRSDIFAVGAVFYELLSYSEAFSGASTRQIEDKVLQAQPAPLLSLVPDLDPEIAAIVARALEKDPARRYQDAGAFEEALEHQRWRLGRIDTPAPTVRPTPPPQNAGRKSRDSRAEVAFQRCLAYFREGAVDAARRFAMEALAEDPAHEGASAFLERLERQQPDRWPLARPSVPPSAPQPQPTAVGTWVEPSHRPVTPAPPTIVSPRKKTPASRPPGAAERYGRLWNRHRTGVLVVALLAVLAGIGVVLLRWLMVPSVPRQQLTISKPSGGTITANGIRCGTMGSDCTTTLAQEDAVVLETHADAGFMFTGYTGDCVPNGRTIMSSARTCGGTFEPLPVVPPTVVRTLTVTRPAGGTLLSAGIQCGTLGADCSADHPEGEQIRVFAKADAGFAFQGFTGDCDARGDLLMTAPRTCGATFVPRAAGGSAPPPPVSPADGGVVTRGPSADPEPNIPAPPPPIAEPDSPTVASGSPSGGGFGAPPIPTAATPPVAPPISPEVLAKDNLNVLVNQYCSAYERLDAAGIAKIFPRAPAGILEQFRQYKSAGCTVTGPPEFVMVDPEAGTATIRVGLKLTSEMRAGKSQPPQESVAEVKAVRPEPRGIWHIDTMVVRPKR